MKSNLYVHIPYEQVSSAHSQARNHLDPHQEDEELICKPGHRDILQKLNRKHHFHVVQIKAKSQIQKKH